MTDTSRDTLPPLLKVILVPLGLFMLFLSWRVLFFYLNVGSELLLAPWEYDTRGIPPVGTLPRRVNDFFDGSGSSYFALLLVTASVVSTGISFFRSRFKVLTVWRVALSNFAYVAVIFLSWGWATVIYGVFSLPTPATPSFDAFSLSYFFFLLALYVALQRLLLWRPGRLG